MSSAEPGQPSAGASLRTVAGNVRLVSLCTMLSRILGLIRDAAMAATFGAGPLLDAFTVAFRLPNLARVLLGEGALATAFLPAFTRELDQAGAQAARRLATATAVALILFLTSAVLVLEVGLVAWSWWLPLSTEAELLRSLIGLMLPYVVMVCLAAHLSAVLQGLGRFGWPALLPVIFNLGWLAGLVCFVPWWTDPTSRVQAMAVCVLAAGLIQVWCPIWVLSRAGYSFDPHWRSAWPQVGGILRTMTPVIVGLSITQFNTVIDSFVAWGFARPELGPDVMPLPGSPRYPLAPGAASALYFGQRLYQFPLGVFGVALGTVLYPLLAMHAQRGEHDKLRADLSLGLRLVAAIGIPASAGLMLISRPIAGLCFQYGRFDADDAHQTGLMIFAYGSAVWAYCGLLILNRGFYAVGDRITPLKIGLAGVALNLIGNLTLIWWLHEQGLAFSTAGVAMLQCLLNGWVIQFRVGQLQWVAIGRCVLKTLAATMVLAAVCLATEQLLERYPLPLGRLWSVFLPVSLGSGAYLGAAWLIGLHEPWLLLRRGKFSEAQPAGPPTERSDSAY